MSTTKGTGELLAETTSRSSTPDGDKDSLRTPLPPDKDGHASASSPVLTEWPHSEFTVSCGSRRTLTQIHSTFNAQHWNRAAAPVSSIAKTVAARLPFILFAALSPPFGRRARRGVMLAISKVGFRQGGRLAKCERLQGPDIHLARELPGGGVMQGLRPVFASRKEGESWAGGDVLNTSESWSRSAASFPML